MKHRNEGVYALRTAADLHARDSIVMRRVVFWLVAIVLVLAVFRP